MTAYPRARIAIALALLLAAAAAVPLIAQNRPGGADEPAARPLDELALQGLLRPSREVTLALGVPGVVADRPVEVGDRVKEKQLLAELDSELERATLAIGKLKASSDHQIRAAELTGKQKQTDLERIGGLVQRGAATQWELQQAQVEVELAKVRVEYAKFQQKLEAEEVRRAEVVLAKRRCLAPWDGVISETYKEVGEAAEEHAPLVELVKLDVLWVELNVPGDYFGQVAAGRKATVTMAGRSRVAAVVRVDPRVDRASDTFGVMLELDNQDAAFAAGKPATVTFTPPAAAATD